MINKGKVERKYTSTGKHSGYKIELHHQELNEYKHLSGSDIDILQGKVHNQVLAWDRKWEKHLEREEKQRVALEKKEKEEQASDRTKEAKDNLFSIEKILEHTLDIDDAIDWSTVKNNEKFISECGKNKHISYRKNDGYPDTVAVLHNPPKPNEEDVFIKIPLLMLLFGQKEKVLTRQRNEWEKINKLWQDDKDKIKKINTSRSTSLKDEQNAWLAEEKNYEKQRGLYNNKIDALNESYKEKDPEAVVEYCEIVLNNSVYPVSFPKDFEIQYNETNGILLIDYELPSLNNIPSLNIVKYIKSRDEFEEKHLSHAAHEKLFDSTIYKIALRTIHEIFEADVIGAIEAVNFNGIVTDINPATGHKESSCIISIQAIKDEFEKINLGSVDPKQCFKSLKGVGSSKLSSMTAIRPILELDKSDRRFKDHYNVAGDLDNSTNLAAMDWEDFEHLIRELFEKEFARNGGEVKVTQASSDGGVDAVAFDPDPIRGGKIVIQAKRYTNTVGVAAVRDLYGTVMNEGATKGVLVTTADYGPDSYDFAKGKPLTLLNGSNLLHLLEKHGHEARIDIKEAKKILNESQ